MPQQTLATQSTTVAENSAINFEDIFKSSFLDKITAVSLIDVAIALGLAFVLGLLIFFVYKRCYAGVMYSASFGVTLIALTMITALLIVAVTSNIVLSLGMVGALSIVRFRTAIKDPVDIAFLFWSIAVGIVVAAGLIPLAVLGSVLIAAVLLVFSLFRGKGRPYILVLHCTDADSEARAAAFVKERVKKLSLKSKSVAPDCIELNYEVRLKGADADFVNSVAALQGVTHAVLVSYNGDYMS